MTPAVNVTEAPEYDGLALAASVTLGFSWIVSVSGTDVLRQVDGVAAVNRDDGPESPLRARSL